MGGRGRRHGREEREVTLAILDEAQAAGARLDAACATLGVSARTIERWRGAPGMEDARRGPLGPPPNALSSNEQARIVALMTAPELRGLTPKQLVPRLADEGIYLASESTMYRLQCRFGLRKKKAPRSRRTVARGATVHCATGPNQVWSWDITYLPTKVRGRFLYLYLVVDVWSRCIVAWRVHDRENGDLASAMIAETCRDSNIDPTGLVLHSDNGSAMRGNTMLATLQWLGIVASFSRPHVSDDNAYSEALFRTLKHGPTYPKTPFLDLAAAREWVARFVAWYNGEHRHSAIRFVTPAQRHRGLDVALLAHRATLYARARAMKPERWTQGARDWTPVAEVVLNPDRTTTAEAA